MTEKFRIPNPQGAMPERLYDLRESNQEILEDRYQYAAGNKLPFGSVKGLKKLSDRAVATLKTISGKAVAAFLGLGEQRDISTQPYRKFQIANRIEREAKIPDLATTAMVVGIFLLFEGCVGAGLFIADGKADIPIAFIYGFSVAAINIATGMVTGFFACRYIVYRLSHQKPEPRDRKIRWAAWGGLIALLGVMITLNFSAGRVRATGSHINIFDFETVTLLATFNDYYAIALMVLGLLGGIVAVYKGWTGIKDPIPSYAEAWQDTKEAITEAAEEIYDQYIDQVDTVFENAVEPIEDYKDALEEALEDQPEALAEDRAATDAHNKNIDAAILEYRQIIQNTRRAHEYITKQETETPGLDLSAFEALRVPDPEGLVETSSSDQDVLALAILELEAAREDAIAAFQELYTAFVAEVPASALSTDKETKQ